MTPKPKKIVIFLFGNYTSHGLFEWIWRELGRTKDMWMSDWKYWRK